jgi:hypothetical protein
MSESIGHASVAAQILELAQLTGYPCEEFQHEVIGSRVTFAGSSTQDLINVSVVEHGGLVITRIDIKTLFDTTDALLDGDFRSTDDFNPYGPFAAAIVAPGIGQIIMSFDGVNQFSLANDFTLINRAILFGANSSQTVKITATTNQPAGKNLMLVTAVNCFTCRDVVISTIQKKTTQIINL